MICSESGLKIEVGHAIKDIEKYQAKHSNPNEHKPGNIIPIKCEPDRYERIYDNIRTY